MTFLVYAGALGASDKIAYRLRDQHFVRSTEGSNARAGMHCNSSNGVAYKLAFTSMKAAFAGTTRREFPDSIFKQLISDTHPRSRGAMRPSRA
jgi:hypothetical protein